MLPTKLAPAIRFCFAFFCLFPFSLAAQVKHLDFTSTDQFLLCAAKVFGKPVLISPTWGDGYEPAVCPSDPQDFRQLLDSKGISVFDTSKFIYLIPSHEFENYYGSRKRRVLISWVPQNGRLNFAECTPLSERDLRNVGQVVLQEARMPFFSIGNIPPGSNTDPIQTKLFLSLYDCRLKPDVELVFGTLGYDRLIYGEMKNRQFDLLWGLGYWPPEYGSMSFEI